MITRESVDTLKLCPCCAMEAEVCREHFITHVDKWIECINCGLQMHGRDCEEYWNRRDLYKEESHAGAVTEAG